MADLEADAYSDGLQTPASDDLWARFSLRRPPAIPRHLAILAILVPIVQCSRLPVEIPTDAYLKKIPLFAELSLPYMAGSWTTQVK